MARGSRAAKPTSKTVPKVLCEQEIRFNFEKKCRFFLVFWLPLKKGAKGAVDVFPRGKVPRWAQSSGKECDLDFTDENNITKPYPARIIQGGDDEEALYAVALSATDGRVLREDEKRHESCVIAQKSNHAKNKRKDNAATKAALKRDERILLTASSVCKPDVVPNPAVASMPSASGTLETLAPISQPLPPARNMQETCSSNLDNSSRTLPNYISLYADGVSHHATPETLRFLEALYRTAQENSSKIPESTWMCEVLGGLFHFLAKNMEEFRANLRLPESWFSKDSNGKDLFGDQKIFVPDTVTTLIRATVGEEPSWGTYVVRVLNALYANNLSYLTALGSGDSIGVDPRLYSSLYEFCKKKYGDIPKKKFNSHINLTIQNRKKMRKRGRDDSPKDSNTSTGAKARKQDDTAPPNDTDTLVRSNSFEGGFDQRINDDTSDIVGEHQAPALSHGQASGLVTQPDLPAPGNGTRPGEPGNTYASLECVHLPNSSVEEYQGNPSIAGSSSGYQPSGYQPSGYQPSSYQPSGYQPPDYSLPLVSGGYSSPLHHPLQQMPSPLNISESMVQSITAQVIHNLRSAAQAV